MDFIHYGSNKFQTGIKYDQSDFKRQVRQNKPRGLWACPRDAKLTWKNYVLGNWPEQIKTLYKHFSFTLSRDAKILDLNNLQNLKKYSVRVPSWMRKSGLIACYQKHYILWDKIMEDYDGAIVYISKMNENLILEYGFVCYDVDSLVVWNLQSVKELVHF